MRQSVSSLLSMIVLLTVSMPAVCLSAESWQTSAPVDYGLNSIWGMTDAAIYAVGENGTLAVYDGSTWDEVDTNTIYDLNTVWGISGEGVIAAGELGMIFVYNGYHWVKFEYPPETLYGLWGSSVADVYAVGELGTIRHFDGSTWVDSSPTVTAAYDLYCIWGSAEDDIWIGSSGGRLFHYAVGLSGPAWGAVSLSSVTSQDIYALWGTSESNVYAAGSNGQILRYNGTSWSLVYSAGFQLYTVWGSAADDIFAAGEAGSVYHYDGDAWERLSSPSSETIRSSWGSSSGTVYFACDDGTILRYVRDDSLAPVIVFTDIPKDNDGKAYVPTPVTFMFSEEMDASTITSTTVTFMQGANAIPGTVTLSGDGTTVTLSRSLEYSTTYTAKVVGGTGGVRDKAGNVLASDYSISFTTEPTPEDGGGDDSGGGCFISTARW